MALKPVIGEFVAVPKGGGAITLPVLVNGAPDQLATCVFGSGAYEFDVNANPLLRNANGGIAFGCDDDNNPLLRNADNSILLHNGGSEQGVFDAGVEGYYVKGYTYVYANGQLNCQNNSIYPISGYAVQGSLNGVMSVLNDGESAALPLLRKAGISGTSLNGMTISPGTPYTVPITTTGAANGDLCIPLLDTPLPGAGSTGGVVIQSISWDEMNSWFVVTFLNTDLANSYTLSGTLYLLALR